MQSVPLCPFDSLSASSDKPTSIKIGSRQKRETLFLPGFYLGKHSSQAEAAPISASYSCAGLEDRQTLPKKPYALLTLDLSHIRNVANTPMGDVGAVIGTTALTSLELCWPAEEGV